mmetsp:Transcript_29177/g.78300  ORF Transcript_29177/g.78300 Transcript_29177/m.78300 type:complete len:173 (+) Transcript_29177:157-675(+)
MDGLEPWGNEASTDTLPASGATSVVMSPVSAYTTRRVSVSRQVGPAARFTATGIVGNRASAASTNPSAVVNDAPSSTSAALVPPGAAMLDREAVTRATRREQPGTAVSAGILATTRMEVARLKETRHSTGAPSSIVITSLGDGSPPALNRGKSGGSRGLTIPELQRAADLKR